MKKSRFTDSQVMAILKRAESGVPVNQICRDKGISSALFYRRLSKFGGMDLLSQCGPVDGFHVRSAVKRTNLPDLKRH